MIKFKKLRDVSVKILQDLGFNDGDYVAVLLSDGRISCGRLEFITEYSTMFDVNLIFEDMYQTCEGGLYSACGICKVEFEP